MLLIIVWRHDIILVLGYFNKKNCGEEALRPTIEVHSLHEKCNVNGLRHL